MRLRKKPWVAAALSTYPNLVIEHPAAKAGHWLKHYGGQSIHVEIGTGRGSFISAMAERHPDVLFVGIETVADVLYDAVQAVQQKQLTNVKLLQFNAFNIDTIFAPGEVDRIYLNFSDPWPKRRHAKRRLSHMQFLQKYRTVLRAAGWIWLKTDNENFFESSLNSFADFGMRLANISLDLHNSSNFTDNIMTEYELRFSTNGHKILRCEASFNTLVPCSDDKPLSSSPLIDLEL